MDARLVDVTVDQRVDLWAVGTDARTVDVMVDQKVDLLV
jgi:hypothetical protein